MKLKIEKHIYAQGTKKDKGDWICERVHEALENGKRIAYVGCGDGLRLLRKRYWKKYYEDLQMPQYMHDTGEVDVVFSDDIFNPIARASLYEFQGFAMNTINEYYARVMADIPDRDNETELVIDWYMTMNKGWDEEDSSYLFDILDVPDTYGADRLGHEFFLLTETIDDEFDNISEEDRLYIAESIKRIAGRFSQYLPTGEDVPSGDAELLEEEPVATKQEKTEEWTKNY